jgi:hypothetical protein
MHKSVSFKSILSKVYERGSSIFLNIYNFHIQFLPADYLNTALPPPLTAVLKSKLKFLTLSPAMLATFQQAKEVLCGCATLPCRLRVMLSLAH